MSQLINQSIGASRRLCGSILAPMPCIDEIYNENRTLGATGRYGGYRRRGEREPRDSLCPPSSPTD